METFSKRISMNEYNFYKILDGTNITPRIISINRDILVIERYYDTVGNILMNKNLSSKELEKMTNDIKAVISRLHEIGILHGDLHNDNIVCNEELTDFRIIDFEYSTFISLVDKDYIDDYCDEDVENVEDILEHEMTRFLDIQCSFFES